MRSKTEDVTVYIAKGEQPDVLADGLRRFAAILWTLVETRKAHTCAICHETIGACGWAWKPMTNTGFRMVRICVACWKPDV